MAYLFLVRPVSAWDDWRFGIWNALHDGEITIMHRESPDVLVMFVSIPYVRRRIQPLTRRFDSRLRWGGNVIAMREHKGVSKSGEFVGGKPYVISQKRG